MNIKKLILPRLCMGFIWLPLAGMFILAACTSDDKEEPAPIYPVQPAYRLNYMVTTNEAYASIFDTTYFLYNDADQLTRIVTNQGAFHHDTATYNFLLAYNSSGELATMKLRYPLYDPNSVYVYSKSGKNIKVTRNTFFSGEYLSDDLIYLDNQSRIIGINDTSQEKHNIYQKLFWSGQHLTSIASYERQGNARILMSEYKYSYDESRNNPFYIGKIQLQRGLFNYGRPDYWAFSPNLVKKSEYDAGIQGKSISTFDWTFNAEGLPVKCIESVVRTTPADGTQYHKWIVEYHYTKR